MANDVSTTKIRKNGYVLTPGRYVGAQEQEDDCESWGSVPGIRKAGGGD